ncbi:MAG: TolB family protein [Gammaproteobacteria bacterium]
MNNNLIIKTALIITLSILINACGLTPIKKDATRKKVHTKDRPNIEEVREAKPSKERNVKKAEKVIKTTTLNSKLIFSSNRTGNLEIWLSDLDGENAVQLTTDDKYESNWPRVSPDRTKVLFYRAPKGSKENAYDQFSLWQLNLTDQSLKELIPHGTNNWTTQGVADWSPDGSKIVMAASQDKGRWHLYITDADGKNPLKVSKRESLYLDPSWSPDGSKLVFSAFPDKYKGTKLNNLEIFTSDIDGSNEKRLTFDTLRDHDPYWSPNGKWIAYETEVQPLYWLVGKWALRITDANSGVTRELLNDGHINTLPRWNPDSNQLYFHRLRFKEDKKFSLWKINIDGSNLQRISGSNRYKDIQADIF